MIALFASMNSAPSATCSPDAVLESYLEMFRTKGCAGAVSFFPMRNSTCAFDVLVLDGALRPAGLSDYRTEFDARATCEA